MHLSQARSDLKCPGELWIKDIQSINCSYRKITKRLTTLVYERLKAVIAERVSKADVSRKGTVKISCFGIKDEKLAEYLEELYGTKISVEEFLVKRPEFEKKLSYYYSKVSDIENLESLVSKDMPHHIKSYTSPVMIDAKSGYIEPREVVYLRTKRGTHSEYVGIGYDDSVDGELSPKSSLEIATYLGRNEL